MSITGVFNNLLDKVGLYPPPWAVEELALCLRVDGKEAELRKLLGKYPDAARWQTAGMQPLDKALWHENLPAAKILAECDPSILKPTWYLDDNTPLRRAVAMQDAKSLSMLAALGADMKETDNRGYTLLHHAALSCDKAAIVDLLVSLGADATVKNELGETPLMTAVRRGKMIEAFAAHDGDLGQRDRFGNPLSICAVDGDAPAEAVASLALLGADLDAKNTSSRNTAIERAIIGVKMDATAALLKGGAALDVNTPLGELALSQARTNGHAVLKKLLQQDPAVRAAAHAEAVRERRAKATQEEIASCNEGLDARIRVKTIRLKGRTPS